MAWREVSREDGSLKGIEEGVKNSFWWVWLEEKDQNGQFLSEYIRKVNIPGKALCTYCNSLLNYSSGGKKGIKNHSQNKKHEQMVNLRKTNTTLPSTLLLKSSVQSSLQEYNIPYQGSTNCAHGDERARNVHAKRFSRAQNYVHVNQSKHL